MYCITVQIWKIRKALENPSRNEMGVYKLYRDNHSPY